jgi:hypothetical protein
MNLLEIIVVLKSTHLQIDLSDPNISNSSTTNKFLSSLRPLFSNLESTLPSTAPHNSDQSEMRKYLTGYAPQGDAHDIVCELKKMPNIEAAYIKPATENPLAPPDNEEQTYSNEADHIPNLETLQRYLDKAPDGIDAKFAWSYAGGRGEDIKVIDIEGGWQLTHIDLRQNNGGIVAGTPYNNLDWRNHGTAVFAQIGGDANGFGVTGISPDAILSAISHGGIGSAKAIQLAADRLRAGDVMLLEMHRPGPKFNYQYNENQLGYICVEWWPDDLVAIKYATSKGVIVVEAAGNGAENLDSPIYNTPGSGFPGGWKNPFTDPTISGAIVVGAGAPPSGNYGADRSRLEFSNYGGRVDCQGWGRGVVTAGYGDLFRYSETPLDENYWYTNKFSGTSSASPIIAGTIACLQGVAKKRGLLLTPSQLRNLLRTTGSPQTQNSAERIGSRPDMRQLISALLPANLLNQEESIEHSVPPPPTSPNFILEKENKLAPDFNGVFHTQAIPAQIIARISSTPKLPIIKVQWYWESPGYTITQVNHKAYITYNEHSRNDSSRTLSFSNNSLISILDFGSDIQGGTLVCHCSISWRRNSDGQTGQTGEGEQLFGILADNPSKSEIKAELGLLELQVIGYKESRFKQFDNASLPLFGPPNGFGIMQLDTPRPTARQLWDWKQNISQGKSIFQQKKKEIETHFKNIYTAHPEAPKLTQEQLKLATYQYYNGGWYWDFDATAKTWQKIGTTSYGDDALRIEKLVSAGTPPADWG